MPQRTGSRIHVAADHGGRLTLGRLLKSGGAGSVFLLAERGDSVAKLYHAHVGVETYARKVEAMLRLRPELPDIEHEGAAQVQLAWPSALARDAQGRFLGFVMPLLDFEATCDLEYVLQERQARAAGLPTGLGAKVTLAANLAAVLAALHAEGHHVVDLKPVNLRFYRRSLHVAMLDCDGFSVRGDGERFPAEQFTPDYLAPEFHRRGVPPEAGEAQDRFALAVVVFQLLNFGIHPFSGRPAHDRVPTDLPGRIAGRFHAYGLKRHAAIAPVPGSGHTAMPQALRELFDRAFRGPAAGRPSAGEWAVALRGYALRTGGGLVVCETDPGHQHFAGLPCAACARAARLESRARAAPPSARVRVRAATVPQRRAVQEQGAPPLAGPAGLPPAAGGVGAQPASGGAGWIAALVLLAAFAVFVLLAFVESTPRRHERAALPAPVQVEAPPADRHRVGYGALPAEALRASVRLAAEAAGEGDWSTFRREIERLRRAQAAQPFRHASAAAVFEMELQHRRLSERSAIVEYEETASRLRPQLQRDRYAHETALMLAWLAQAHGRSDERRAALEQATWSRPMDPAGWFGLARLALEEAGPPREDAPLPATALAYATVGEFVGRPRSADDAAAALALVLGRFRAGLPPNTAAEAVAIERLHVEAVARAARVDPDRPPGPGPGAGARRSPLFLGMSALEESLHGLEAEGLGRRWRLVLWVDLDHFGLPRYIDIVQSSGDAVLDQQVAELVSRLPFAPARDGGGYVAGGLQLPVAHWRPAPPPGSPAGGVE
ncbi:hypothetical protein [Coralloluteibacterium thermophilus]|uniref:Protein kinase domain-containing protein n=1 Tax=Coralloluteibacterium thermophilum TaxID=2707049 RepID=A0ABV9NQ37_9GAMM